MSYVLSVDVGSTNLKAALVDETGRVTGLRQAPLRFHHPEKGAVEHDPREIYGLFCRVCRRVARGHAGQIKALALSTYNLGLLPMDDRLNPLTGVITLMDMRSRSTFASLRVHCDFHRLYRRTGCPPLFHYPFAKIWWLRREKPALFGKAHMFLGLKDYLIYRLTGFPACEASLASCSQLFNIHHMGWDDEALQALGISAGQLPPVVPSERLLGALPAPAARELGLLPGTPLLPGFYDGGALGIGLGALMPGRCGVMNLGTTAMLRRATAGPVFDASGRMRFQTVYLFGQEYFPGGGINNAGSVMEWLADSVMDADLDDLAREAADVPAGSGGLTTLPFLTGERDPSIGLDASGMVAGLRAGQTRAHLFRSAMEGVAYFTRTLQQALEEHGPKIPEIRAGGGGAKSKLWLEILAGVLGKKISISTQPQPALLGNAMAAFTALENYNSLEDASRAMVKTGAVTRPSPKDKAAYEAGYRKFEHLMKLLPRINGEAEPKASPPLGVK